MTWLSKYFSCVCAICTCIVGNTFGQILSQYNQYLYNHYLINPAVAGIEAYGDLQIGFRSQWSGMEGAPQHSFISFHTNMEKKNELHAANPMPGTNTSKHLKKVNAKTYRDYNGIAHHGIGGLLLADQSGPFSRLKVNVTYAYHIPLSDKYRISAGASAGVRSSQLDRSKITLENPDDIAIEGDRYNNIAPDLSVGIWFYSQNLFVGASAMQLVKGQTDYGTYQIAEAIHSRHFGLNAGYKIMINDRLTVSPSAMLVYLKSQPLMVDLNLMANILERLTLGGSYRNTGDITLLTKLAISPTLAFGYSFDYGSSGLSSANYGSHEIMISIKFNNNYKVLCPIHFW